jgi:predicted nucleotidyltransferase
MREGGSIGIVEEYLPRLAEVFEKHGVVLAYLFGSQAAGDAGPLSDVDIAVLFLDEVPKEERFDRVCLLIGELMGVFHRNDVYVVDLGQAPPLLKNNVRVQGQIIYCVDESRRVDFEVETLRQFEDTKPLRQVRYDYLLRRVRNGTFGYPTCAPGAEY